MAGAPMQARKHSAKCGLTANPTTHATIHTTTTWKNQLNFDLAIVTHYRRGLTRSPATHCQQHALYTHICHSSGSKAYSLGIGCTPTWKIPFSLPKEVNAINLSVSLSQNNLPLSLPIFLLQKHIQYIAHQQVAFYAAFRKCKTITPSKKAERQKNS